MTLTRGAGILLGLAVGDALGRPVEFRTCEWIQREHGTVTEMLGNGTHRKPPGTITDDTELALCIARSLAENGAYVRDDVAARFVTWLESGPFDIGNMTRRSLRKIQRGTPPEEAGREVWEASPEGQNAGNGSVMRCAPYAIAYRHDPTKLTQVSLDSSAITHADARCTYGCALLNLTLANLLDNEDNPLREAICTIRPDMPAELVGEMGPIPDRYPEELLKSSGYVIDTLQTSLYHALTARDFESAVVAAVNMGGDTDTVGAVTGALAGARFGTDTIPDRWLAEIPEHTELVALAEKLAALNP